MIDTEGYQGRFYESIRDAYASVDMDGNLLMFNDAFRDMLGYERE